jgi:hypothetical protein
MNDVEKQEIESYVKKQIDGMTRLLKNDIKRMVGTRSTDRPRKIETTALPDIVQRVLDTADEMMGDARGKDAVPGLKTIADALDLSEDALGVQLRRAKLPWTKIRTFLENLT